MATQPNQITGFISKIRYYGDNYTYVVISGDEREFYTTITGQRESLNLAFYNRKKISFHPVQNPFDGTGVDFNEFEVCY